MEITIALVFIGALVSSLTSLFTAVITTIAPLSFAVLEQSSLKLAERLEYIKANMNRYLTALLAIDVFFHTLAAAAAAVYSVAIFLNLFSWIYFTLIAFLVLTFLKILFTGIGVRYAEKLAIPSARILHYTVLILKPIVVILEKFSRLVGGERTEEASREELSALVENAHEEGTLDAGEYRILKNIMRFGNVHISDVMTPRTVVFSCDADITVGEVVQLPELKMYSRFPVWEGESLDGVVGYVITKDILLAALEGNSGKKLRELARNVHFIPENVELDKALEQFLQRRQHMFIIVDEYGGVEGLLTMEDVVEAMLGAEIVDEADSVVDLRELAMQRRDRRIAAMIRPNFLNDNEEKNSEDTPAEQKENFPEEKTE